jgi:hypothetical protein
MTQSILHETLSLIRINASIFYKQSFNKSSLTTGEHLLGTIEKAPQK